MELDIDGLSVPTLWRIYGLVQQYSPHTEQEIRDSLAPKGSPEDVIRPQPKKKNKPMSKHEQERKIQALREGVQQFERHGSGSLEPMTGVMQSMSPS